MVGNIYHQFVVTFVGKTHKSFLKCKIKLCTCKPQLAYYACLFVGLTSLTSRHCLIIQNFITSWLLRKMVQNTIKLCRTFCLHETNKHMPKRSQFYEGSGFLGIAVINSTSQYSYLTLCADWKMYHLLFFTHVFSVFYFCIKVNTMSIKISYENLNSAIFLSLLS